jgi:bacterioferritin (cytochrome b1)
VDENRNLENRKESEKMIDEFALAKAAAERLIALRGGPRFDGKKWQGQTGPAHAAATAREVVRVVLDEAAEITNDLDDAARLKTATRLDAVLRVVKSFPALTIEGGE